MNIKSIKILSEEEQVGLFLSGSAAERNVLYTCTDLDQQEKRIRQRFSVYVIMRMRKAGILKKDLDFRCSGIWM